MGILPCYLVGLFHQVGKRRVFSFYIYTGERYQVIVCLIGGKGGGGMF